MHGYPDTTRDLDTVTAIPLADAPPAEERSNNKHALENKEKIRLLKFMTSFGIGGTERQVASLAARLDRDRFTLSFACLRRWGELIRDIEDGCTEIDEYPIKRLYGGATWLRQWRFSRALAADRIQIMHSYNFYANVFSIPAARLARVPCVVASVRDLGVYLTPAQCRVQRWACGLSDLVLVNAEAIRRWMLDQGIPAQKLKVIHNGVDTAKFCGANAGEGLRQELGIPRDAPLVVMLARLDPKKGAEYFLRAAPYIVRRCPDAYFIVVGESWFRGRDDIIRPDPAVRRKLASQAAELGIAHRVRFLGERQDIPDILSAATVSVLPSLSEGLSNTLLESMAAGVAVVATNVGGTPEAIRNGRDGLLIRPGDTGAIVAAVCAILEDVHLARRLGSQGKARVTTSFSFEAMTRRTEAAYLKLMASKYKNNRVRGRH